MSFSRKFFVCVCVALSGTCAGASQLKVEENCRCRFTAAHSMAKLSPLPSRKLCKRTRVVCGQHFPSSGSDESEMFLFTATPSFIEAPSDVDVNEGGSVKLPCRAQGRPKPRIIWDRIGASVAQTQQQQINEEVAHFLEKDTQEELLAKAKIMSLRSKRSIATRSRTKGDDPQRPAGNALDSHSSRLSYFGVMARNRRRNGKSHVTNSDFEQIMRDEMGDVAAPTQTRIKRQTKPADSAADDDADRMDGEDVDSDTPNVIPIVVFSTQAPQEASRLQVTDNGELILLDVHERDQVITAVRVFVCLCNAIHACVWRAFEAESFERPLPSPPRFSCALCAFCFTRSGDTNNANFFARRLLLQGWYACAALNEAGSTVKRVFIHVISDGDSIDIENSPSLFDAPGMSSRYSNEQNIIITTVLATSPNSLDIAWETNDGIPATSLTLHYRIVGTNEFQLTTAMIDAKDFTINDLRAHAEYEVFASVPHGLSGFISNIRKGTTTADTIARQFARIVCSCTVVHITNVHVYLLFCFGNPFGMSHR